jgi:hypothetical protein
MPQDQAGLHAALELRDRLGYRVGAQMSSLGGRGEATVLNRGQEQIQLAQRETGVQGRRWPRLRTAARGLLNRHNAFLLRKMGIYSQLNSR